MHLIWAVPLIITAVGIIVELRSHNPEHFRPLMDLWWMFGLSFHLICWNLLSHLEKKSYGIAFGLLIGQFLLPFLRMDISHLSLFALSII